MHQPKPSMRQEILRPSAASTKRMPWTLVPAAETPQRGPSSWFLALIWPLLPAVFFLLIQGL